MHAALALSVSLFVYTHLKRPHAEQNQVHDFVHFAAPSSHRYYKFVIYQTHQFSQRKLLSRNLWSSDHTI